MPKTTTAAAATPREFALWVFDLLERKTAAAAVDGADEGNKEDAELHLLVEKIHAWTASKWTKERSAREAEHLSAALLLARDMLGDADKAGQLEQEVRHLVQVDMPALLQRTQCELERVCDQYEEEWKPFGRQAASVLLDGESALKESEMVQSVLARAFSEGEAQSSWVTSLQDLVHVGFAKFDIERQVPEDSSERLAWLALASFKSSLAALRLYDEYCHTAVDDDHHNRYHRLALALAMVATSVDVKQIQALIQRSSDGGDNGHWGWQSLVASFYERHGAKLAQRKQMWQAIVAELTTSTSTDRQHQQGIKTVEDVKRVAVHVVNKLVSQWWTLPRIAGRREGVAFACEHMRVTAFHIPHEKVSVHVVRPTLDVLRQGQPVLVLSVSHTECTVSNMHYSVKQEYFPFLATEGEAQCQVRGVEARCEVHLVRTTSGDNSDGGAGVLQARLKQCRTSIHQVQIEFVQGKDVWLMNLVKDLLAAQLQLYLQSFLQDELQCQVQAWIDRVNNEWRLRWWPLVRSTVHVDVSSVPTVEHVLAEELSHIGHSADLYYSVRYDTGVALTCPPREGEEKKPVLVLSEGAGAGGGGVVVELFSGDKDGGKLRAGDRVVGVNGTDVGALSLDRVKARLRRAKAPLIVTFAPSAASLAQQQQQQQQEEEEEVEGARVHVKSFTFTEDKLFITIKERGGGEPNRGAVVAGFPPAPSLPGGRGPAERAGVPIGWILTRVNSVNMLGHTFDETMDLFARLRTRPVVVHFTRNPYVHVELHEPALGVDLVELPREASSEEVVVVVTGFSLLRCACADELTAGGLASGAVVCRVGSTPTNGLPFDSVVALLKDEITSRPPAAKFCEIAFSVDEEEICGKFEVGKPLGMVFYESPDDGRCRFKSFQDFEGPVQQQQQRQRQTGGGIVRPGQQLVSVNGDRVTSVQQAKQLLERPSKLPLRLELVDREVLEAVLAATVGAV